MKRKWVIITLFFTLIMGGLKTSPVLASKQDGEITFIEKVSLYRNSQNMAYTTVSNSIISLYGENQFLLPSSLIESHDPEIKKLATQLTVGLDTEEEKSMALFKWVALNISYDTETYFQNPTNPRYYSALETLKHKVALCSGYANLNAALHRSIGIEAKVVYGEGHAWNEVKITGKWQEQDPTYGSGTIDIKRQLFIRQYKQQYFSTADLRKEGEFPW